MWVWRDGSGRIASVTGSIHQETLDWLRAEDEQNHVPSFAPSPVRQPEPEPEPVVDEPVDLVAPKHYDAKADWVAFAVASTAGSEEPVSEVDADAMTKADLIELYGGN